jgi:hypothetical protein
LTTQIEYKTPVTGQEDPTSEINKEQGNKPAVIGNENKDGERPSWMPAEFKGTADEFVASLIKSQGDTKAALTTAQQELAKFKKGGEENKPEGDDEKKPADGEESAEDKIRKAAEEAGVDNAPYQKEFDETGDLAPEAREKAAKEYGPLIKKMFGDDADPLDVVNRWVDGQKANIGNYRSEVFKAAGGEESYGEMVTWATANYSEADKAIFNKAVNGGDLNAAKQAIDGLASRYSKANGTEPKLLGGDLNTGTTGFKSTYEMQKAIADPRYEKDPVYRKSVEQRIGKSNFGK